MFYNEEFVFFFQAEDGIRDLVRSRGLGDVYKRQLPSLFFPFPLIDFLIALSVEKNFLID